MAEKKRENEHASDSCREYAFFVTSAHEKHVAELKFYSTNDANEKNGIDRFTQKIWIS